LRERVKQLEESLKGQQTEVSAVVSTANSDDNLERIKTELQEEKVCTILASIRPLSTLSNLFDIKTKNKKLQEQLQNKDQEMERLQVDMREYKIKADRLHDLEWTVTPRSDGTIHSTSTLG